MVSARKGLVYGGEAKISTQAGDSKAPVHSASGPEGRARHHHDRDDAGPEAQPRKAAIAVPLILIGGWMLNIPGGVFLAPLIVVLGLMAGSWQKTRPGNRVYQGGLSLAVLLLIGAEDGRGVAVALMFLLMALTAELPRSTVDRGFDKGLLWLGLSTAVYTWAYFALGAPDNRALGLLDLNPNATGGLLVVSCIWSLVRIPTSWKRDLLLAAMVTAIMATGSRWAFISLEAVLLTLVLLKILPWRSAGVVGGTAAVVLLVQLGAGWGSMARITPLVDDGSETVSMVERVAPAGWPSVMPAGYRGNSDGDGAHNVLVRAAYETGWPGLGILLLAIGYAFYRGRREHRVMLGTLLMLGMMDYYVWGPFQLAPLLWMTMGAAHDRT